MHAPLAIEELCLVIERHDRSVPDVRVEIERAATVAPEGNEFLRRHIITGQGERNDEALAPEGMEQLAAVGVVIGAPDERAFPLFLAALARRFLRPVAPAEQVAVAHGVVARVERLALPFKLEQPLSHSALVAGVLIDRAP